MNFFPIFLNCFINKNRKTKPKYSITTNNRIKILFIFISGASASGKSTIALQLFHNLRQQNIATETLSMDDFYERKANLGNGELNFDKLGFSAIDSELYDSVMTQLAALKMVELPIYSFEHNDRLDTTRSINAAELQVVIVEGIYALHHIPQLEHADTLSFLLKQTIIWITKHNE